MPRPTPWMRLFLVAMLAACKYQPNPSTDDDSDGPPIGDGPLPDAGPCQTVGTAECVGDELRVCSTQGDLPEVTNCGWGCDPAGTPHCLAIAPAGGAATKVDADPEMLAAFKKVTPAGDIDTTAGTIDGATFQTDFGFQAVTVSTNSVAVFRVNELHVTSAVSVRGTRALVIVADGPITIDAPIDLVCDGNLGVRSPGPGGHNGGEKGSSSTAGEGPGGGATTGNSKGGGGGGYGGAGGLGGDAGGAGGTPYNVDIAILDGGSGGGGAKAGGGAGGGGGGAIQLISNTSITIGANGSINAGGCGGEGGAAGANDGGGGGGSGGAILLEAPTITIDGQLAVNGGGGGASANSAAAGDGGPGLLGLAGGLGGVTASTEGADGGAGGFGGGIDGAPGGVGTTGDQLGSGGGGGVGRIRFHTRLDTGLDIDGNAILSPNLDNATCTKGTATIEQP